MKMWKSVLVIYDIEDNKIRYKVVKELESYGVRIQKSAFECYVDGSRLTQMISKLRNLIGETDSIRIYTPVSNVYDVGKDENIEMYTQSVVIL